MKHPLLAAAAANRLHGPTKKQRKATGGGGSRPAAPRAGMQLYLDFGQRSFGRQITCPECGLMYTEGEPNDEAGHRAHHERAHQRPSYFSLLVAHLVSSLTSFPSLLFFLFFLFFLFSSFSFFPTR